jgi:hypothetical protein
MLNSSGEFTVPCWRPFSIANSLLDVCGPSDITNVLFVIISRTILIKCSGKFFLINLYIRPVIQTVSKAFSRSIKQAATRCFAFSAQQMSDVSLFIA